MVISQSDVSSMERMRTRVIFNLLDCTFDVGAVESLGIILGNWVVKVERSVDSMETLKWKDLGWA